MRIGVSAEGAASKNPLFSHPVVRKHREALEDLRPHSPQPTLPPGIEIDDLFGSFGPLIGSQFVPWPTEFATIAPRILVSRLRPRALLGRGLFGMVWSATPPSSGSRVAVKQLCKHSLLEHGQGHRAIRELRALHRLRHPFILPLLGVDSDPRYLYLIVPLAERGTLHSLCGAVSNDSSLLRSQAPLPHRNGHDDGGLASLYSTNPAAVRFVAASLLCALSYLHVRGVVYRDLKADNVLVRGNGYIWLADFSFARSCNWQQRTDTAHAGSSAAVHSARGDNDGGSISTSSSCVVTPLHVSSGSASSTRNCCYTAPAPLTPLMTHLATAGTACGCRCEDGGLESRGGNASAAAAAFANTSATPSSSSVIDSMITPPPPSPPHFHTLLSTAVHISVGAAYRHAVAVQHRATPRVRVEVSGDAAIADAHSRIERGNGSIRNGTIRSEGPSQSHPQQPPSQQHTRALSLSSRRESIVGTLSHMPPELHALQMYGGSGRGAAAMAAAAAAAAAASIGSNKARSNAVSCSTAESSGVRSGPCACLEEQQLLSLGGGAPASSSTASSTGVDGSTPPRSFSASLCVSGAAAVGVHQQCSLDCAPPESAEVDSLQPPRLPSHCRHRSRVPQLSGARSLATINTAAQPGPCSETTTATAADAAAYPRPSPPCSVCSDHDPALGAADVYALGVLLFELVTGTLPFGEGAGNSVLFGERVMGGAWSFPDWIRARPTAAAAPDGMHAREQQQEQQQQIQQQRVRQQQLQQQRDDDSLVCDVIRACLSHDPAARPTAAALQEHPYFHRFDWGGLLAGTMQSPIVTPTSAGARGTLPGALVATPSVDVEESRSRAHAADDDSSSSSMGNGVNGNSSCSDYSHVLSHATSVDDSPPPPSAFGRSTMLWEDGEEELQINGGCSTEEEDGVSAVLFAEFRPPITTSSQIDLELKYRQRLLVD